MMAPNRKVDMKLTSRTETPVLIDFDDHVQQIQNCVELAALGYGRTISDGALREAARLIEELLGDE